MYRCACGAGHKGLWHSEWQGLPPQECLTAVHPYLAKIGRTFGTSPLPADHAVGVISKEWSENLRIPREVIIGGSSLDAHAGAVGAGIRKHVCVTNLGTSAVNMLIEDAETLHGKDLKHVCGQAENSIIPGYVGVETSQAAFGDVYAWLNDLLLWPVRNIIAHTDAIGRGERGRVCLQAEERLLIELSKQAEKLSASDELIALDWFNGRRYPNQNELLKSGIVGLSLGIGAPALYQTLVMATVFGQKRVIDCLIEGGIKINEIIAVGGIAQKSPYIMQMMADVLDRPIQISASDQACARGAAIYAAVACGVYQSIPEAQKKLCEGFIRTYIPGSKNKKIYSSAYEKYRALGDFVEGWEG